MLTKTLVSRWTTGNQWNSVSVDATSDSGMVVIASETAPLYLTTSDARDLAQALIEAADLAEEVVNDD